MNVEQSGGVSCGLVAGVNELDDFVLLARRELVAASADAALPTAWSAATWAVLSCSWVETRAYPIRIDVFFAKTCCQSKVLCNRFTRPELPKPLPRRARLRKRSFAQSGTYQPTQTLVPPGS